MRVFLQRLAFNRGQTIQQINFLLRPYFSRRTKEQLDKIPVKRLLGDVDAVNKKINAMAGEVINGNYAILF